MHTNETKHGPETGFHTTNDSAEGGLRQFGRRTLRTRLCTGCGLMKPSVAFRRANGGTGPRPTDCRTCQSRRTPDSAPAPALQLPPGCKRCSRCGETREQVAFNHDARSRDGRAKICRACNGTARAARKGAPLASLEEPDELLGMNTAEMEQRASLGIAIAHATCPPGHRRTRSEIAAYAGVTEEAIRLIEVNALRKVRGQVGAILREAGCTLREVQL